MSEKIHPFRSAIHKAYGAVDSMTTKYMAGLQGNGFEPATSRYVNDFLHPDKVTSEEQRAIALTQAEHHIEVHMPVVTDDEKVLLLQAIGAYWDVCKGAAYDHINPKTNEHIKGALMKVSPALFFVCGFPEAIAVNTLGPKRAQRLGMWGGSDKKWGEVWLKSGPMVEQTRENPAPAHASYNDWGVWFAPEKRVRDADHPTKTYTVKDGQIIHEPAPAPRETPKRGGDTGTRAEGRSTAAGVKRTHDQVLYDERHNPANKGLSDEQIKKKAREAYDSQENKGKRGRADDWR